MGQVQARKPQMGLTFEDVWAMFQETDKKFQEDREQQTEWKKQQAEQQAEWKKQQAEQQAEWKKQQAEWKKEHDEWRKEHDRDMTALRKSQEKTARQMKETDRRLGNMGNRFGEIVEYMVAPNLRKKFREMGLNFPQATQNADVADYDNNIFLEIDVKLENGDRAMLVEVKSKLTTEDVKEHVERLEKMRVYANLHGDKRAFLGAVAGVVMTPLVKEYALRKGFYVIEPSGETFNITSPDGQPKEW